MPLSELPIPVMFLVFLLLFLLIGIYPTWKRAAAKIRRLLVEHKKEGGLYAGDAEAEQSARFVDQPLYSPLDDFEIMVLRRLAQNGAKGLTRKQLDADLFLGKATVNESLQTMLRRGLVYMDISPLFSFRFHLSDQGRAYAIEHEFIPRVHAGNELS